LETTKRRDVLIKLVVRSWCNHDSDFSTGFTICDLESNKLLDSVEISIYGCKLPTSVDNKLSPKIFKVSGSEDV